MAVVQVNWSTLWMSWKERELREMLVLPLIVGIMLVPIGLFSGAHDRPAQYAAMRHAMLI